MPQISELGRDGNFEAIVEDDGRVVYLSLWKVDSSDLFKSVVWVRNRVPAPLNYDSDAKRRRVPPLMPTAYCRHPMGAQPLTPSEIKFVWLPEGNGVALYESGQLLAVIPPGASLEGCKGYSRDAIGNTPLAWELTEDSGLHKRFREAREFWEAWRPEVRDSHNDPWRRLQSRQMAAYIRQLGEHSRYFSIDQTRWPPKAVLQIPRGNEIILVTVGVCIRPQPKVEFIADNCRPFRRIELGVVLQSGLEQEKVDAFGSYISGQANLPWTRDTWLGHGHSIPCDALKGTPYTAVILARSEQFGPRVVLEAYEGDPVSLLWMVPVTQGELDEAKLLQSDVVLKSIQYPR
jgi:hypothetical protein